MASKDPARPNVLFVLSDDQGAWALGCAGNADIRTPTLDGLAASGTRFENFFCTSPVCSPARASLLTGQIPSKHGVHDWIRGGNYGPDRIDYLEGATLLTDVVSESGYRCALVGKWHLGASDRPRPGFVRWFAHQAGMSPYYDAPFFRGTEAEIVPGYVTDALAQESLAFLRDEATTDSPFWLSLHFTAPHSPWMRCHPDDLMRLYEDCAFESSPQETRHPDSYCGNLEAEQGFSDPRANLQGYYAAITGMDRALGRVLAALDADGLRESTLVVFLSDNGMNCGHHGIWGKGNGTFPQNMYDSSVKVPLIVSQPGRIAPARTTASLGSGYDLYPTLLDYLGLPMASCRTLPGRSLRAVFEGQEMSPNEAVVVFDEYGPVRMIRTACWKYVHRYPFGPHLLFDLAADPGERHDLVAAPEHAGVLGELRARLHAWFALHADPLRDGAHEGVWGRGQLGPVGPQGQGRPAFAEKAPSGAYARRTYGDFVDVAEANRRKPASP